MNALSTTFLLILSFVTAKDIHVNYWMVTKLKKDNSIYRVSTLHNACDYFPCTFQITEEDQSLLELFRRFLMFPLTFFVSPFLNCTI